MPAFVHHDLRLLNPAFNSPLIDTFEELGYLRRHAIRGTTPAPIFFQLKGIFHILESLASARIEGNHTTLADYVDHKIQADGSGEVDQLKEIANIEVAMKYVEEQIRPGTQLTEHFIRELHAITVKELDREGDKTPGAYRVTQVSIAQSNHLPPEAILVPQYMSELVQFLNREDPQKYDLMKIALAHHRFGWVHPFSNGNGRVVRLLTYALLMKYGFNVQSGSRLLNPTAVFCNDRDKYYEMLGVADVGSDDALEKWCVYVLEGILAELKKVDQLTDFSYLLPRILIPAINYSVDRKHITELESRVLLIALKASGGQVKSADMAVAMPDLNDSQRTRQIAKLVKSRMLVPTAPKSRIYMAGFTNNYLIRGIILSLENEGFISRRLRG